METNPTGNSAGTKREAPVGILRLEMGKPRRASTEFKFLAQGEPTSPQPSVDRLSVTFAEDSVKSDSSAKGNYSPEGVKMDKVHFPPATGQNAEPVDSDEEDYSASVNAIIQRKASTRLSKRRSSRRASSPFSPDILPGSENGRRRSSVYTTSSGDTAITMDDNFTGEVTQEEIFENIKLHKEVLSNVKMQPWNMRKKLKLVVQAKNYIKQHEGALQERLAQSHSTRDMLARWNIYIIKKWQRYRREIANLSNWFIPWELKIKEIESHFGSVVASYFTFLRWLFWVNIVLGIVLMSFVAIPEMLTPNPEGAMNRKFILPEEKYNATNFLTLWDFEGIFKYSPLFYGWYTNSNFKGYRLPFAYFVTGLVAYAYSFFATLRKMAENSRMSKLSEKDDECIFSWKLFTAWDYMIGNTETAHNRVASIVVGFKEALLEEAEKKRQSRNWKVIVFRILVNTAVLGLLTFSAFAVVMVVKRSTEPESGSTLWRRNEITIVMSLISTFFPMVFELLGFCEQYHPRKQLRIQLARIMLLNLLNLYSLIFALFDKISDMTQELEEFRNVALAANMTSVASVTIFPNPPAFTSIGLPCNSICNNIKSNGYSVPNLIPSLAANLAISTYPMLRDVLTSTPSMQSTTSTSTVDNDYTNKFNNSEVTTEELYINGTVLAFNDSNTSSWDLLESDKEAFVDYLSYVLFGFYMNDTYGYNYTNHSYSNFTEVADDYLPSSTSPSLNISKFDLDERFDNELSTVYDNNTTLSTFDSFEIHIENTSHCMKVCLEANIIHPVDNYSQIIPSFNTDANWNYSTRSRLRSLCWETMFGQELIKLTVMDLIMTVISTMAMDFLRGLFVRVMNRCWCWDLEKKFPQYGDFKVAESILHLVNNQGMVWMGMFFSPGLVVINIVKLYAMMYLRAWAVLTCNVPHEIIFRASRSNNFYYALLLMMLFLCVLPVGYAIVRIRPSWHCGPFSQYERIFHIFTKTIKSNVPEPVEKALDYIASPGIVIPLLVLLILVIYYLISLTNALREANSDLKFQLRRERTEERRKMFQLADKRRRGGSGGSGDFANTPFGKWKKLISTMPGGKSFDDTPRQESYEVPLPVQEEKADNNRGRDFFSKLIKKALGKSSTSEEDNVNADEGTDTEQHESLPEDLVSIKETRPQVHQPTRTFSSGTFDFRKIATTALTQKKNGDHPEIEKIKHTKMLHHRDTFELKRISKSAAHVMSKEMSQDSGSSLWMENIPVITISKTESAECLEEKIEANNGQQAEKDGRFKPKIRVALRKQGSEIDEDVICHFNNDIVKAAKLEYADAEQAEAQSSDGATSTSTKSESSNDTTGPENSTDTVLNQTRSKDAKINPLYTQISSANESTPRTESSSGYNENTSL